MSGSGTQNSNEPKNSKFKQQQLPAWQPILTAGTVLPTFFVIGIAFIPIGVGLMYFSDQVKEIVIDYTDCKNAANEKCADVIQGYENGIPKTCTCEIDIDESDFGDKDWPGPVLMYYGLTNFYQNHRRYVKSRDDKQLYGDIDRTLTEDCEPFKTVNDTDQKYAPCGAIANSLFNDTIKLKHWIDGGDKDDVPLNRTGIAWDSDKTYKFKNPSYEYDDPSTAWEKLKEKFEGTAKPMDWQKNIWELDKENPDNNGFLNEDLIVWMRTAALPNFRKLYRRINHDAGSLFENGLPKDRKYSLQIDYNYKVTQFKGTKKVIISTTSLLGGKNPFLGIAYIVVGCICFLMGVIFLFVHLRFGKTTQDMLSIGPNSQYNAH